MPKKSPIRTCISCGTKRNKLELIRLVLDEDDSLIKDSKIVRKGRGVYICNSPQCYKKLLSNRRLNTRFKKTQEINISLELKREILEMQTHENS